jgi:hypothetical protein
MSVVAKGLISAKYASDSSATEFEVATGKRVIIDKFTANNSDSEARVLSVYIVPPAGSPAGSNLVFTKDLAVGTTDLTELQNQILNAGETVVVDAEVPNKIVIRMSGREIS